MQDADLMGSLDVVGMFPNIPVKKTLEVVREELEADESLKSRTKWGIDDIMKLLEISIETYFKTIGGNICIGLRRSMCLEKVVRFEITLFFGKDKWMMCSLFGGGARKIWSYLFGT